MLKILLSISKFWNVVAAAMGFSPFFLFFLPMAGYFLLNLLEFYFPILIPYTNVIRSFFSWFGSIISFVFFCIYKTICFLFYPIWWIIKKIWSWFFGSKDIPSPKKPVSGPDFGPGDDPDDFTPKPPPKPDLNNESLYVVPQKFYRNSAGYRINYNPNDIPMDEGVIVNELSPFYDNVLAKRTIKNSIFNSSKAVSSVNNLPLASNVSPSDLEDEKSIVNYTSRLSSCSPIPAILDPVQRVLAFNRLLQQTSATPPPPVIGTPVYHNLPPVAQATNEVLDFTELALSEAEQNQVNTDRLLAAQETMMEKEGLETEEALQNLEMPSSEKLPVKNEHSALSKISTEISNFNSVKIQDEKLTDFLKTLNKNFHEHIDSINFSDLPKEEKLHLFKNLIESQKAVFLQFSDFCQFAKTETPLLDDCLVSLRFVYEEYIEHLEGIFNTFDLLDTQEDQKQIIDQKNDEFVLKKEKILNKLKLLEMEFFKESLATLEENYQKDIEEVLKNPLLDDKQKNEILNILENDFFKVKNEILKQLEKEEKLPSFFEGIFKNYKIWLEDWKVYANDYFKFKADLKLKQANYEKCLQQYISALKKFEKDPSLAAKLNMVKIEQELQILQKSKLDKVRTQKEEWAIFFSKNLDRKFGILLIFIPSSIKYFKLEFSWNNLLLFITILTLILTFYKWYFGAALLSNYLPIITEVLQGIKEWIKTKWC